MSFFLSTVFLERGWCKLWRIFIPGLPCKNSKFHRVWILCKKIIVVSAAEEETGEGPKGHGDFEPPPRATSPIPPASLGQRQISRKRTSTQQQFLGGTSLTSASPFLWNKHQFLFVLENRVFSMDTVFTEVKSNSAVKSSVYFSVLSSSLGFNFTFNFWSIAENSKFFKS